MSQTVLIAPVDGTYLFFRADFVGGQWFAHPTPGPFHAMLPGLVQIMTGEGGPDLTFSTFRGEELLERAPDDFDLAERAVTEVLCPLGDPGSPQIWSWLTYHDPGRDPVAGERFVAKQLPQVIREAFPSNPNAAKKLLTLDELKRPHLLPRRELWIRRHWLGAEIAPGSFQHIRLDLGGAPEEKPPELDTEAAKKRRERVAKASRGSAEAGVFNAKLV